MLQDVRMMLCSGCRSLVLHSVNGEIQGQQGATDRDVAALPRGLILTLT